MTSHICLLFIVKFYDKSEGMKGAPSQQASLNELWKKAGSKKGDGKTKAQLTEISSLKEEELPTPTTPTGSNAMDMDAQSSRPPESSRTCKICTIQAREICSHGYMQLPPIPKDLQSERQPHP